MNDAETGKPELPAENGGGQTTGDPGGLHKETGSTDRPEKVAGGDDLNGEISRLSRLSSDMRDGLSNIIRKTRTAADKLDEIQNSVERKKQELIELHAIEACVTSLKALEQEHRVREEKFAALMETRRRQWAEEENLRRSEEEELRKRERALNSREEECGRLIQELDSLMKRLAEHKSRNEQGAFSSLASASRTRAYPREWHSGGDPYPGARRNEGSPVISVRRMLIQNDAPGASRTAGEENRDLHPFENNS